VRPVPNMIVKHGALLCFELWKGKQQEVPVNMGLIMIAYAYLLDSLSPQKCFSGITAFIMIALLLY